MDNKDSFEWWKQNPEIPIPIGFIEVRDEKLPIFDDNATYKGRRLNPDGYAGNGNDFLFPIGGYAGIAELGDDTLRI